MNEPKPAYNTVSTVVRVLEGKGFIDHKAYGNSHVYFPLISEVQYKKFTFDKMMSNYFSNSYESLVSFIANEKKLDIQQLDELTKLIEDLKSKKKWTGCIILQKLIYTSAYFIWPTAYF